ncbi:MAG: PilC/PilY family type IV pilus protein, partial [Pseudomonadota bacterium]
AAGSDPDYFLDTPPGKGPNQGPGDTNWDDNQALPLVATRRFLPGAGSGPANLLQNPLWYAAKWGGFEDTNANNKPDVIYEWDKDGNGDPDTYFYVVNPLYLEEKLNQSFASILQRTSSGTAASVISGSRTGEGALYQALFYPSRTDVSGNNLLWSGQVYSLFVDHYGNFREDTNQNAILDMINDRIVQLFFDEAQGQTMVRFLPDSDGDGLAEGSGTVGKLEEMRTIWDGGVWLAQAAPTGGRELNAIVKQRRLWTWIDRNNDFLVSDDGLVDGTEGINSETILFDPVLTLSRQALAPYMRAKAIYNTTFAAPHTNLEFTAVSPGIGGNNIQIEYVNPGPNNNATTVTVTGNRITVNLATDASGTIVATASQVMGAINSSPIAGALMRARLPLNDAGEGVVPTLALTSLSVENGTRKLMEYIAGQDKDYWRKRQIEVAGLGIRTWKLGDIIYSTPTIVAGPAEDYYLIYDDASYLNYRLAYGKRRHVIFVGSNDGVLHAFNAGFWDPMESTFFKTRPSYRVEYDDIAKEYDIKYAEPQYDPTPWDLGAEIWGFIPQSVLPHLEWLTEEKYPHVYYVDLKPRAVDIKFSDGSWHTILICGLRLGGKDIATTDDFNYDGTPAEIRTFRSEYFALDVTDPEQQPKLLWSFSHEELGLTTNFPTVVRIQNSWYVILGSGPKGPNAFSGQSDQQARIFVLNAQTGAMARTTPFVISENTSFMADPVAIDMDFAPVTAAGATTWNNELVYIGSTSGSPGAWGGRMYRIKLADTNASPPTPLTNPNDWVLSTLFDAEGPISASPNVSRDVAGRLWVYFGTGRFWSVEDKAECLAACAVPGSPACTNCINTSKRWFFGIKEPLYTLGPNTGRLNYVTVLKANLRNTTGYVMFEDGYLDLNGDMVPDKTFTEFVTEMNDYDGWRIQFADQGERSSYQPVILGGIVTFTTYTPSTDICDYEG